jgi:hypothetical protein
MAKFIVEISKAYLVDAVDEEEAVEAFDAMGPTEVEAAHASTGNWTECTAVYEDEDQEVDEDQSPFNNEEV